MCGEFIAKKRVELGMARDLKKLFREAFDLPESDRATPEEVRSKLYRCG